MPGPSPLRNNGWIPHPWAEFVSKTGTASESSHSWEKGNRAIFSILVNWDNWESGDIIIDLLGSCLYNPANNTFDRKPPVQHPYLPHLRATEIVSARGHAWSDKRSTISGIAHSGYELCIVTIAFTQPHYRILTDSDLDATYGAPRQEYRRWLTWTIEPGHETLSKPEGENRYAEGTAGDPQGNPVRGSTAQFLQRSTVCFRWLQIPRYGLFSAGGEGPPNNIMNGLGKINSAVFPPTTGFPAGTLLLEGARFTEIEAPHKDSVNGIVATAPRLAYNIDLFCVFRDPPHFGTTRGWNLAPAPGKTSWYLITSDGLVTGTTLLQSYDFTQLFVGQI
jgi:hypothetical protein